MHSKLVGRHDYSYGEIVAVWGDRDTLYVAFSLSGQLNVAANPFLNLAPIEKDSFGPAADFLEEHGRLASAELLRDAQGIQQQV